MGYRDAAMQMIAARDSSACKALVAAGAISSHSYCGVEKPNPFDRGPGVYKRPAVSPLGGAAPIVDPSAPVTRTVTNGVTCYLKPGTTRTIITDAVTPQQRAACAATLGLRG